MNTIVRTATLSDLPALRQLQQQLIQFERPFDPTMPSGHVEYYNLRELLHSEKVKCLVVETEGRIVGCGFGKIKRNPEWPKSPKIGYIGLMFIEKNYRHQGIGNQIITSLLHWFKECQISDIRLKVYAHNSKALKAYEKYGFTSFMTEMRYSKP